MGGCHHLPRHKFLFDLFSVHFFVSDLIEIQSREANNSYCAEVYCFSELLCVICSHSASIVISQNGGNPIYDLNRRHTKVERTKLTADET